MCPCVYMYIIPTSPGLMAGVTIALMQYPGEVQSPTCTEALTPNPRHESPVPVQSSKWTIIVKHAIYNILWNR